jgi:hypothetical protein
MLIIKRPPPIAKRGLLLEQIFLISEILISFLLPISKEEYVRLLIRPLHFEPSL